MHLIVNNSYKCTPYINRQLTQNQLSMKEEAKGGNNISKGREGKENQKSPKPSIFQTLNIKIGSDNESLYLKLNRIFLSKYSQEERGKLEELLQAWKEHDLQILLDAEEFTGKDLHHFYKQVDVLAARVYNKVLAYLKQKRTERDDSDEDKEWEGLRFLFWKEEIEFTFDRYFWGKRIVKNSGISYNKEGIKQEAVEGSSSNADGVKIYNWIQACNIPLLKQVQQFLADIQLIVLEGEANNSFLINLERVGKKEQKELYLKSIACEFYEDAKALHACEFKTNTHQQQALKAVRKSLPNYYFYKEQGILPRSISSLHSYFQNYRFLESKHDYIQWMFPNHYGSAFNSKSFQLTYLESLLFLDDSQIALRMLQSIYIFLDFIGIRLHMPSLKLSVCSYDRLRDAILINYHNHLRIMRLLACLSVTGFRPIALELIQLLRELTAPSNFLERQRHEFEASWEIYGEEAPGVSKERAKAMCFLEEQQFPPEHKILSFLRETMEGERKSEPIKEALETKIEDERKSELNKVIPVAMMESEPSKEALTTTMDVERQAEPPLESPAKIQEQGQIEQNKEAPVTSTESEPSKEAPASVMEVKVVVKNGEEVKYLKEVSVPEKGGVVIQEF